MKGFFLVVGFPFRVLLMAIPFALLVFMSLFEPETFSGGIGKIWGFVKTGL